MVHQCSIYFDDCRAPERTAYFEMRGAIGFFQMKDILVSMLFLAGDLVVSIEATHVQFHDAYRVSWMETAQIRRDAEAFCSLPNSRPA